MSNRILIISNDAVDVNSLKTVLLDAHDCLFAIEWITTLTAAIECLQAQEVDAILLDLSLPDSTGINTFDKLVAAVPHTPIMILSAVDDALAMQAVQRGAQGYLTKGYLVSNLIPQALRNIIQRNLAEESFQREKSRAEIALNSISDAVICTDLAGNIDYLNIAAESLTLWPREEAHGRPVNEIYKLVNRVTHEPMSNPVEWVLKKNEAVGLEPDSVLVRRDGVEIPIEDSVSPIHDWDGKLTGVVIVFHDISTTQAMSMKMAHLAQHDFLTNLPNRLLLSDRIAQAIALAKRRSTQLAILFLDLDNFKHINDSLGHETGDKLLQSVTKRLTNCVRSSDTVSRQGGDEFVILLAGKYGRDAALTAEKILDALSSPHEIDGRELHVTTSIGISVYPADGQNAASLIKNADTAMYHAKDKGRNNYQFFNSDMNVRAVERQYIEGRLRRALEKREFELHYQPKVNLDSGVITGAEALLRWRHTDTELLLPERFVPIAEDCGLIVSIGRWVLREACLQAKKWLDYGFGPMSISVNISAFEFSQPQFFEAVRNILNETGLPAHYLELEITESVLMRDVKTSANILQNLKDLGVQLAVDDFGTGYSSLSYLTQFPIDVLKIDQSFVNDIACVNDEGIIVSAVIGMGNSLKLRVIAEGVESQEQLAFLKEHHCEEGQGFLFSQPLLAEQYSALLANKMGFGLIQ